LQKRELSRKAQTHAFVSGGRKGDKLGQANRLQQAARDTPGEGVPGAG
jgi:hypothetical protein